MLFILIAIIIIGIASSCFINIYRIEAKEIRDKLEHLRKQNSSLLAKYQQIEDAHEEKKRILASASFEARIIIDKANKTLDEANTELQNSKSSAERIINEAKLKAQEIAGDALDDRDNANI